MRIFHSRLLKDDSGVTMIEFALLLPIFLLIVFAIIEFGLYMVDKQQVANAVSNVAMMITKDPTGVNDPYAGDQGSPWKQYAQYKANEAGTQLVDFTQGGNYICTRSDPSGNALSTATCGAGEWYATPANCTSSSCDLQITVAAHVNATNIVDPMGWGLQKIDVVQHFYLGAIPPGTTTAAPTGFQHIQIFTHSNNVHYTAPSCTGAPTIQLVGTHCIAPNGSDVTASNYNAGGNSTSNGSFAVPDGVTVVKASIIGGGGGAGGGGGGYGDTSGNGFNGGGGGSGGMVVTYISNPPASITYYAGEGGDSGAGGSTTSHCGNSGENGNAGKDSYIIIGSTTYTAPAGYGGGAGGCGPLNGVRGFGGGSNPSSYTIGTASNLDANTISLPGMFGGMGAFGGNGGSGWLGGGGTAGYGITGQDYNYNYNGNPGGSPGSGYGGGGGGGGGGQGDNGHGPGHGEAGGGGSEGAVIFEY